MNTTRLIMNTTSRLKQTVIVRKRLFTQLLSFIAAATLLFYTWCHTTCAYLKGTFLGIDLLHIGIVFTAFTILLTALKYDSVLIALLSSAAGVESFLVGQQIVQNVYCPYCLIFGVTIFLQFFMNFDVRKARTLVIAMVVSGAVFPLLFNYSEIPSYGLEGEGMPQAYHSECSIKGNSKCDSKCYGTCGQQGSCCPIDYQITRNSN